jgi:hypothetical protein
MKTKKILKTEIELAGANLRAAESELNALSPADFGEMYPSEDARKRCIELREISIPELKRQLDAATIKWQECE